jgi:hypothetical protein
VGIRDVVLDVETEGNSIVVVTEAAEGTIKDIHKKRY